MCVCIYISPLNFSVKFTGEFFRLYASEFLEDLKLLWRMHFDPRVTSRSFIGITEILINVDPCLS